MKTALAICVLLSGCATSPGDYEAQQRFRDGFMGALSIGAQQEQMRNQQRMYAPPLRSLNCTTRYVGNNAYTDCW